MDFIIPYNIVRDLFKDNWNEDNVDYPRFMVPNEGMEPPVVELNNSDVVSIISGVPSEVEQPIGTWQYVNRIWKISADINTKVSRERLWKIKSEIQRICYLHRHSIENFQRIQYMQFSELVDAQFNVWAGKIDIELVSNAIYVGPPVQ